MRIDELVITIALAASLPAACGTRSTAHPPPAAGGGGTTAVSAAAEMPRLADMHIARPAGKVTLPVEVRFLVSGVVAKDQPATVDLAFVPRVEGAHFKVQFPDAEDVTVESGGTELTVGRIAASDVIRRRLTVTPRTSGAARIRALVSMTVGGGHYFAIYVVPLGAGVEAAEGGQSR